MREIKPCLKYHFKTNNGSFNSKITLNKKANFLCKNLVKILRFINTFNLITELVELILLYHNFYYSTGEEIILFPGIQIILPNI